jgi:polysaccharide pyruvyl transferase WcaK-like protein
MKIAIVGWYGKSNVGDEAFRDAMLDIFHGHTVSFVTPPRVPDSPDVVILGGGNVITPFYMDVLPNCPRYALGVGLGYESEVELLEKYNFRHVIVRNVSDLPLLLQKLKCPVMATPDLAFMYRPSPQFYRGTAKTIGVLLTDYINPAIDRPVEEFGERAINFQKAIAKELDRLIEEQFEVVLLPCSTNGYGDDRRIALDVAAWMQHYPKVVMDSISPQNMIDIIAGMTATICVRFHAHIFSMIAGVPFVSIPWSRKVRLLLSENNLTETIGASFQGKNVDMSRFTEVLETVIEHTDEYRGKFQNLSANNRKRLEKVKQTVRQDWLGVCS